MKAIFEASLPPRDLAARAIVPLRPALPFPRLLLLLLLGPERSRARSGEADP